MLRCFAAALVPACQLHHASDTAKAPWQMSQPLLLCSWPQNRGPPILPRTFTTACPGLAQAMASDTSSAQLES